MSPWVALLLELAAGALVGWAGHALGTLTAGAALVLALVSAFCSVSGGWAWGAVLLLAVLSNCLWQRYRNSRLPGARAGRVGWVGLSASLVWPVVLAGMHRLLGAGGYAAAFVGALAALTADGWATHLGMLSRQPPRLLLLRRRVAPGTPGAVTLMGHIAALNGAWLVGLAAMYLLVAQSALQPPGGWDRALRWLPLCATLGGLAGCLVDSFLGATAQALYHCEQCDAYSETPVHDCGRPAVPVRGWPWLTHDGVNLVSTVVGAAVSATLYWGLAKSGVPW